MRTNCVNSFSAFGEQRNKYLDLFDVILRQHYVLYPSLNYDWKLYLMTDKPFTDDERYCTNSSGNGGYSGKTINRFAEEKIIELRVINPTDKLETQPISGIGMLWRMLPIWENDVNYVFCRDLDSILTPRQMKFVLAFLKSNYNIHNILDNPSHAGLMGGMCGFKAEYIRNKYSTFASMIKSYNTDVSFWSNKNTDQLFLNNMLKSSDRSLFLNHKQMTREHDRLSDHKNCIDVQTPGIPAEILDNGDNYCNYIGAVGLFNGGPHVSWSPTHKQTLEFYEKHISKELLEKIKLIEKD